MREVFLLLGLGLVICATAQSLPPNPSSDRPPTLIDQNESKKCGKSTPSVPSNRARRADIGQFGGQKTAELIEKQKVLAEETPADEPKKEAAKPAATKEDKSKPRSKREDKKPAVSNPFPTGGIPVGEPNKDSQGSKAATKDDKSKTRSKRNDNKIAPSSNQGVFGQQSGLQTSQISQQPIGQSSGLQIPPAIPGQGQLPAGQIPPQSLLPGQVPNQFPSHFSNQIPIESQVPQLPGLVPGGQLPTHISSSGQQLSGQQSQVHLNSDESSKMRPKRQLEPKPILPQAPNEPAPKLPPAPDSESNEEPSDPINPVGKRQKRQSFASNQEFEAEQDSSLHHHSSSSSSEQVEVGNQGGPVHEQPAEQRVKRQEPDQELGSQSNSQDEDSNDSAQNRARRYANNKNANANQSIEDNTEEDNEDEDDEQDTVENEDDNNWQAELVKDANDNDSDENEPDDELSPAHDESESNSDEELLNAHNGVLKEHTKPPGL